MVGNAMVLPPSDDWRQRCPLWTSRLVQPEIWPSLTAGWPVASVWTMIATERQHRAAALAHVLARAVRENEVAYGDARRVIVHELRRLNNNQKPEIRPRSAGAQRAIEQYGEGEVPKNGSDDALHADHYATITPETFERVTSIEAWVEELNRLATSVVCVTAKENYRLEQIERAGLVGPQKYAAAEITFVDPVPWA